MLHSLARNARRKMASLELSCTALRADAGKALAAPWRDFGGVFMCFLEANHGIESLFASRNSWDVMMCFNMFLLDLTWFYGVLL